ncbi:galectin-9 [Alligator mississippiensis]|uniref:galectin-9 n=1 Tax=Alligator mississippiensis TaxID=8496 RepID=UPI002877288E|nr:galectin-9 [Alligator mississippiensis]
MWPIISPMNAACMRTAHRRPGVQLNSVASSIQLYSAPLLLQKTPGPGVSPASSTPESCPTVLHMSTNAAFGRCQRNDRTVHKPITGGLLPSKSITIKGNVLSNSNRFHINLKSGNDIAFHLNPRFDENVIVRNSFVHQTWGTEERDMPGTMPLAQGQNFTIRISCQDHCFKVAVNEQDQFEYKHRVQNLQQIDTLEITGDVTVTDVQI